MFEMIENRFSHMETIKDAHAARNGPCCMRVHGEW